MKEVERIIRVDHAGEYGAISIYSAQLVVARIFYKDIVFKLEEMLEHEKEHFKTFNSLLLKRGIRHCYALRLWALGGFALGIFTAVLGRKSIWVCTTTIETTVLNHLKWQLDFLRSRDLEAYDAVLSIKSDEESHQQYGVIHGSDAYLYRPIVWVVKRTTAFAIWLSTKL